MMGLTKAQRALLAKVKAGAKLVQHFDVWVGYWWELDGEQIRKEPPEKLKRREIIVEDGENVRLYSGRRAQNFALSIRDDGRLA